MNTKEFIVIQTNSNKFINVKNQKDTYTKTRIENEHKTRINTIIHYSCLENAYGTHNNTREKTE